MKSKGDVTRQLRVNRMEIHANIHGHLTHGWTCQMSQTVTHAPASGYTSMDGCEQTAYLTYLERLWGAAQSLTMKHCSQYLLSTTGQFACCKITHRCRCCIQTTVQLTCYVQQPTFSVSAAGIQDVAAHIYCHAMTACDGEPPCATA